MQQYYFWFLTTTLIWNSFVHFSCVNKPGRNFCYERIHTVLLRHRRNLSTTAICPRCEREVESTIHTIKDCPNSSQLWLNLLFINDIESFFEGNSTCWIKRNALTRNNDYNLRFLTCLWITWLHRNQSIIANESRLLNALLLEYHRLLTDIRASFPTQSHSEINSDSRSVGWIRPCNEWVKLNTDGASKGNPGPVATGGVFRSCEGRWLGGFHIFIGQATNLCAELTAIRDGLLLAKENNLHPLILESDSAVAIHLIQDANAKHHPLGSIILDCKRLLFDLNPVRIQHTLREGNMVAYCMMNLGVNSSSNITFFDKPPSEVLSVLNANYVGVCYSRF